MQARRLPYDPAGRVVYWQVREALGRVIDPATATDIVELGWVAGVVARDGRVAIGLVPPEREQPRLREVVFREVEEAVEDGWRVQVRHLSPIARSLHRWAAVSRRAAAWCRREARR